MSDGAISLACRMLEAIYHDHPSGDWDRPFSVQVERGVAVMRDTFGRPILFANPRDFWALLTEANPS